MNGTCPIQVIENNTNSKWLTLDKFIKYNQSDQCMHLTRGVFKNIVGWGLKGRLKDYYAMNGLKNLVNGRNESPIYYSDIIRNPTIEELMEISEILKKNKYKLNLKTYKLTRL